MPLLFIKGRVIPETPPLSLPDTGTITWTEKTNAVPFTMNVNITNSVVVVRCHVETYYDAGQFPNVEVTRALEYARAILDCFCFGSGIGRTLILEEMVTPNAAIIPIRFGNEVLGKFLTAFDLSASPESPNGFAAMFDLVGCEPPLFLALNDLIVAITMPGQVAINCGRAIEGLRKILVPDDPTRKAGWAKLQNSLNLQRSYREFITNASTDGRHGDRSFIPAATIQEILERSWTIMNRFLEYRKRGSQDLPVSDFPALV